MSTCLANNRDLHSFWQHDVLDNMDCATLNSTCFALILFSQFNILLNNMQPDNKILSSSRLLQQAINVVSSQQPIAVRQHDGSQQGRG